MSKRYLDALYAAVRDVPDFPKPGILFRDITPLLLQGPLLKAAAAAMAEPFAKAKVSKVLGIESRGFILGAPVAMVLKAGFIPARKSGKLPWERHRIEYQLEYGTDAIEIHRDAIAPGDRVLIVDDLIATGGTAAAAAQAVAQAGGRLLGFSFLIELADLNGRSKLGKNRIHRVLSYPRAEGKPGTGRARGGQGGPARG